MLLCVVFSHVRKMVIGHNSFCMRTAVNCIHRWNCFLCVYRVTNNRSIPHVGCASEMKVRVRDKERVIRGHRRLQMMTISSQSCVWSRSRVWLPAIHLRSFPNLHDVSCSLCYKLGWWIEYLIYILTCFDNCLSRSSNNQFPWSTIFHALIEPGVLQIAA